MKRYLALLLAILLLLMSLVGCKKEEPQASPESSDTPSVEAVFPKNVLLSQNGNCLYTVVIPQNAGSKLQSVAQKLVSKLSQVIGGAIIKMNNDATVDGNPKDSEYEIIIGNCLRTDTQEVLEGIAYDDYRITVTKKNIVIASRSESAAEEAVWEFIAYLKDENIVRDQANKTVSLTWKNDVHHVAEEHTFSAITLGGTNVNDFRIVYPSAGKEGTIYRTYAEELQAWIGNNTGLVLKIVPDSEPAVANEILVGKTERPESTAYYSAHPMDSMEYSIGLKDGKLHLAGAMPLSTQKAIGAFEKHVRTKKGTVEVFDTGVQSLRTAISPNAGDYRFMQYNLMNSEVGWGGGGSIPFEVEIRKEIVSSIILGYSPDAMALNEFFEDWRDQLPPLLEQEYTFVEIDYKGTSNRSVLAYKTTRFDLIESGVESIETSFTATVNNRCVTWAVLEDKETDERFVVFGTHLSPDGGEAGEALRTDQAQLVLELVDSVSAQYGGTIILMGDFNTTGGRTAYQLLDDSFDSAFSGQGIDHIFYDPAQITLEKSYTEMGNLAANASDHKPRIADIALKDKGQSQ